MEVILDELTPIEFFNHGGIVKLEVTSNELIKVCNIKKKYTFFDYKGYSRFFRNLYIIYLHNHSGSTSDDVCRQVNKYINFDASIGKSEYVVDLNYDHMSSYENARFYYSGEKKVQETSPRDPFGIKNVNFSTIDSDDDRWDEFTEQRLERGFDSSELWSLDGTIAKFIYPRLKAFAEDTKGTCYSGTSQKEWDDILQVMVDGFELLANDKEKNETEVKLEQKALDLFAKHFKGLYN